MKWNEGDWIDFMVLRAAPVFLIALGGINLWAAVVLIENFFWSLGR